MSGGTRAPTRAPRGRPAPGGRLARLGPRLAWLLVALLALACAALVAALLLDDEPSATKAATGGEAKAPEPGGRPVGFPVRVEDAPSAVAVGPRLVWVVHEGSGTLAAVDPRRNELIGTPIAIGGRPRYVALAGGSLWISNFDANQVTRVIAGQGAVTARVRVGRSPWGIAAGAPGGIWVVNHDDDTIQQISTATSRPVGTPIEVGQAPVNASYGYGSVWVSNSQDDTVSRVDLGTRSVVTSIPVGDHPEGLSVGSGGVWVANLEEDTVSRIDPARNRVIETIPVGDRPLHLKTNGTVVWVPNSGDGTLSVIDSATNKVVGAPLQIGRSAERVGAGVDAVWAISAAEDTLTRVELAPR